GGDSELLIKQLKNRFFATPFLMLQGIYNLYLFNKNL
ncbi:MAG: type III pantothenate kinase, partial [Oleispira sp.]